MNVRPLEPIESDNLAALNSFGCSSALLFVTTTGLEKAIMDATEPLRRLFKDERVHDYQTQVQGPDGKVTKKISILLDSGEVEVSLSLYRPRTKSGDPRLWVSNFRRFASADDACALFVQEGKIFLLNLTRSSLSKLVAGGATASIIDLLQSFGESFSANANELLGKLSEIAAAGPLKAVCQGDTAIGRSIETALGIPINSNRSPDFKGIELKSGRSPILGAGTRATLFACVPDWKLSKFKSSKEILERFGYERDGDFKLYCSVSTRKSNSQGLQLKLDEASDWLREICVIPTIQDVCVWTLDELHSRLAEKHRETFWVKAKSVVKSDGEWFELESVIHTARPSFGQFDRLLADGTVTLDHLVKRTAAGGAHEKGPLFKVERNRVSELFLGAPRAYIF